MYTPQIVPTRCIPHILQAVARVIDAQDKLVEAAKSGTDLAGSIPRYIRCLGISGDVEYTSEYDLCNMHVIRGCCVVIRGYCVVGMWSCVVVHYLCVVCTSCSQPTQVHPQLVITCCSTSAL